MHPPRGLDPSCSCVYKTGSSRGSPASIQKDYIHTLFKNSGNHIERCTASYHGLCTVDSLASLQPSQNSMHLSTPNA
jgi:hypothetical protein